MQSSKRSSGKRAVTIAALWVISMWASGCDLSLSGGGDADPVASGGTLTYQFTVATDADLTSTDPPLSMCVYDTLPTGVTLQSATTSVGPGCTGTSPVICDVGALDPTSTALVTIAVTVDASAPATLMNVAIVTLCVCNGDPTCAGQISDPTPANNTVSTSTEVVECLADSDCDDLDPCTTDTCTANQCSNPGALPPPGCRLAPKHLLILKNAGDDSKDKLVWKWLKGDTPFAELGDPVGSDAYRLCITDAAGAALHLPVGAGAPWGVTGSGFQRTDPSGATSGATKIVGLRTARPGTRRTGAAGAGVAAEPRERKLLGRDLLILAVERRRALQGESPVNGSPTVRRNVRCYALMANNPECTS